MLVIAPTKEMEMMIGFLKLKLKGCTDMIQSLNDLHPPVLHDPETPRRHAVDAPVGDALVVADRDGEAAVVGAHHLDHRVARLARDLQRLALASVRRLVFCPVRILACKIKGEKREFQLY